MNKLISTNQLRYSVAVFIVSSSLLTKALYVYAKNQAWISVVIGSVISLIIISIYGRLINNHPGRSLVEINNEVFGSIGGKVISFLYIFYFISLAVLNTRDLGSFVSGIVLPNTPIKLIYVMFLLICVYAVRRGAVNMTRYGTLFLILYIAAIFFNGSLLLNKTHPGNLLPVFTLPIKNYLIGAHIYAMLPACEVIVFMMFAQHFRKPDEAGKALRSGMVIASLLILYIVLRDTSVMGKFIGLSTMPTFSTVRLIDIGDILTRLDIIYAVTIMMLLFFKVSILMYASVAALGQLFNIERHRIFSFITAAFVVIYAGALFHNSAEQARWFNAAAQYSTVFLFVLPLVTLIVSEAKKPAGNDRPTDDGPNAQQSVKSV